MATATEMTAARRRGQFTRAAALGLPPPPPEDPALQDRGRILANWST